MFYDLINYLSTSAEFETDTFGSSIWFIACLVPGAQLNTLNWGFGSDGEIGVLQRLSMDACNKSCVQIVPVD